METYLSDVAKTERGETGKFNFHGSGKEYFGIWIVNLLLTIVTLGVYIPWARVRTRRYMYQNTELQGHRFDYLADPKKLLLGYLIVGVGFILYTTSQFINPFLTMAAALVFAGLYPWLVFKSIRFMAANSAYRNISFRFEGTCGQAYKYYLLAPIIAMFSIGLAAPWAVFKQKKYFYNHMSFGNKKSVFSGKTETFYKIFLAAFALLIFSMVVFGVIIYANINAIVPAEGEEASAEASPLITMVGLLFYVPIILIFLGVNVFINNYCWNQTTFDKDIRFESNMRLWTYLGIQVSNILLIVLTLGLFFPWAKMRIYRYRLSCLKVESVHLLDETIAEIQTINQNEGALGDSASEFLDFEIGL